MPNQSTVTQLEELLAQVTEELKAIAEQNPDTGDWEAVPDKLEQAEADENSEADAAEELAARSATVTELETSYRNINHALSKIEAGTFGRCEVCDEVIAISRLEILPSARTCTTHMDEERNLPL